MTTNAHGIERFRGWFRENLAFRPDDRRAALLVVVLHAIVGSALVIAFTARDAIFLGTTPSDKLPAAYLLAAILSGLAAGGVSRLRRLAPLEILFPVIATVVGSVVFALGLLAWKVGGQVTGKLVFILMDAVAAAILVPLWALTESNFTARDTKRVIALVDVGRLVVVLLAGLWTWGMVHVLEARWLLLVAAGLLWLSSVPVILLGLRRALRGMPVRLPPQPTEERVARLRAIASLPHVSLLAAIMVAGVLTAMLVDFQFKTELARRFGSDTQAIARFVSGYSAVSGAVALAIALGAAPFLAKRYGVVGVVVACAVATALGTLSVFVTVPALWAAVLAKSTHELFRFSGTDSTLPLFLSPLPRQLREDATGFMRSWVLPLAAVGTAALLVVAAGQPFVVPAATVASAAVLVVALQRFRTEFARSRQYAANRSSTKVGDKDALAFVPVALLSRDLRDIEMGLTLAPRVPVDISLAVVPLVDHESPLVRRLALEYLAGPAQLELAERVRTRLTDEDADVRASAIRAFCAMKKGAATNDLLRFLNAPEPQVRAAAAAALFFHGGATGQATGARPLMRLLGSAEATEREALAEALAAVALPGCTQPVLALIEDEEPRVRRAAVKAAGRIRSPQLIPVIVDALAKNETARDAREALAGYGEQVLGRLLRDHANTRAVVNEIARILGRLGTKAAIEVLMDHIDDHDETMRNAVFGALARAASHDPNLKLDRRRLEGALIVEAGAAYRALAMSEAFLAADARRKDRAHALIGWAVGEKYERAIARLLRIAQALHPYALISRASAGETLPNILAGAAKDAALPLVDGSPAAVKLASAVGVLAPPHQGVEAWVRELLTDGDRWVICAAAHYAGVRKLRGVEERLVALLDRKDGVIRETALHALERLLPIHELPGAVKRVLWDEDEMIKRSVDRLLERIVDQVEFDRAEGAAQEAFR